MFILTDCLENHTLYKKDYTMSEETIASIATAPGGAIGVIRISGFEALNIAQKVWTSNRQNSSVEPRKMYLGDCCDEESSIEQALLVYMPGPNSYTGEDVVELQCHGGAFSSRRLLAAVLKNGARHAEAGEFTRRAFINGKMDLTQAEAVIDIIQAHSEMALHVANRQLDGSIGRKANALYDLAEHLLSEIEVRMDFVEEDLDFESGRDLSNRLKGLLTDVQKLKESKNEGEVLRHGIKVVLGGAPNAGKSSMMNLFLGRDRAIVTEIPGTTRDVLEEFAHVRGIPVRLFDTAGIREAEDKVEKIGVDRSRSYLQEAQIILWMVDSTNPESLNELPQELLEREELIVVANKCDDENSKPLNFPEKVKTVKTSALTGEGFEQLLDGIESLVWKYPHSEDVDVAVNSRHAELLEKAESELKEVFFAIEMEEWEIVAVALRGVLHNIGSITGKAVSPDILDNIFSRFCIGK